MTDRKRQATQSLEDYDLLKKHHKFLREEEDSDDQQQRQTNTQIKGHKETRGEHIAKKYYDKLYKQYALVNLKRFENGQIGCRWRTEKQVLAGKGESTCGEVGCDKAAVNIFQMNFGYIQEGIRKNALVKVSVCKDCAFKLNYRKTLKKVR